MPDFLMYPIHALGWVYGKVFEGHPVLGFLILSPLPLLVFAGAWWYAIDKYNEQHPALSPPGAHATNPTSAATTPLGPGPSKSSTTVPLKDSLVPNGSTAPTIAGIVTKNVKESNLQNVKILVEGNGTAIFTEGVERSQMEGVQVDMLPSGKNQGIQADLGK